MRKLLAATAVFCMAATNASAQSPIPGPPGPPVALCTDLAIAGWNGSRSPPGAPLADNEVAIYFQVRNNGPRTYMAPDENKQWITLVLDMPSGAQVVATSVLPPSGSGAASLARGASWRGHVRGTLPAGVTRTRHPPARLLINYAPASAGWSPPLDCNTSNNARSVLLR